MEDACCAALYNRDRNRIGIPVLNDPEIFNHLPQAKNEIFYTEIIHSAFLFFHNPPLLYTQMESLPKHTHWKSNPTRSISLGENEDRVDIISYNLLNRPLNLYIFKHKGRNLYCLTIRSEDDLSPSRPRPNKEKTSGGGEEELPPPSPKKKRSASAKETTPNTQSSGKGSVDVGVSSTATLGMEAHSLNEGKSVSEDDMLATSVDAASGCTRITLGNFNTCQQLKFDDQFSETDSDVEEVSLTTPLTKSNDEAHDHDQMRQFVMLKLRKAEKMTSSEVDLESTKNDDSISEIPLKSEAVTFVNPDLSGRSQDGDVALSEAEKCISLDSPVRERRIQMSSRQKRHENEFYTLVTTQELAKIT